MVVTRRSLGFLIAVSMSLGPVFLLPSLGLAQRSACIAFYLRNDDGKIINPLTGENAGQPYSTRQTCGPCHDYDKITKGYHFQQGWDRIRDDFSTKKPWFLSDGMLGKH